MAAPTSQSDRPLADCLLDARARARSGVLVITPAGGKPVQVVFRHGNVRHLAPDLDVLKSSSGDPSSAAAALELGHEIVVDRLAALAEASGDPFTFRTDLEPPAVAVPLEVDPAIGVFKSFDNEATDEQQAAAFGDRWDQLLRPGPSFRDLIPAFEAAFPRGPVPRALVTGQTVSDLVAEADDALTVLRQVYAAVRCGLAELKEQRTPGARMAAHGASPEDVPWSVEDDLVISAPRPTGRERNGRTPTNVEALLTQAREEGDPWIGADVYPDVAARVIPRDARIRSGTDIERRPRTGVSSLIHPDSAQVALNLDLVEGTDEDGEDGKEPPTEPGLVSLEAEPAPSAV